MSLNKHDVLQAELRKKKSSSNAFDRSVNNTPNDFPLSSADFHFSSIDNKQDYML